MTYSIEQIINRPDTWQGIDNHTNSRVILTMTDLVATVGR